jgi:hypothetical protein
MAVDCRTIRKTTGRKTMFGIFLYAKFNVIIFRLKLGLHPHLATSLAL